MRKFIFLLLFLAGCGLAAAERLPVVRAALFPLHEAVISGRVDSMLMPSKLRIGSSFKRGDVLLELDAQRYQIEFNRCKEQTSFAKALLDDKKELRKKDYTSDFEVRKAEHDYLLSAASLDDAALNLSFCTVKAPFDGKIAEFITKDFETVRPGQPLVRIIDDHELLAVINPPLAWGIKAKVGTVVQLKLSNGKTIQGTVFEQAPAADNRTETIRIRVLIDNRAGELCAGMTGELIYGK